MTFRRTAAAALAAAMLAAPAAASAQTQDLRSPDAIDAAQSHGRARFAVPASPGHPSEVGHAALPPQLDPPTRDGGGVDWALVGLGSAGLLAFAGGAVALGTRPWHAPHTRLGA